MRELPVGSTRSQPTSLFADVAGDVSISFEFFPPKTEAGALQLWNTVARLASISPTFVSMTYGAGGSARECSLATIERLMQVPGLTVAAHLTCVGAARGDVDAIARKFWEAGVRHIVALRGDGLTAGAPFCPHPRGYGRAVDLVAGLKNVAPFEISVAAYPEVHPQALSAEADLDNLKRKIDAGASRAITQFFFTPQTFFRFRDRAVAAGINVPIVPGVLPITNFAQTRRFAAACGAEVPRWMEAVFEGLGNHPAAQQSIAVTVAAEFAKQLYDGGAREFHFYTLNRAEVTEAICHLLGRRITSRAGEFA
jgi:methylenetetrahydrofolate reductase (NADPH)